MSSFRADNDEDIPTATDTPTPPSKSENLTNSSERKRMQRRKGRWFVAAGVAVAALIGVAASTSAATGSSESGLSCPSGTMAMVQHATYSQNQAVEGFDTPEEAVENLVAKAYPGMPRGQFKKVTSSDSEAVLSNENARSHVIELDRLVPNAEQTRLVSVENGTAWVVEEFEICEANARKWAAR